jgi:putative ABC transport system permease protein
VDLLETLKDGGHQSSAGGARWRQALVSLEVALALVLAINTGLLLKSIYQLTSTDLGYRTSDVLTASLSLPGRYEALPQQRDFAARWLAALQTLPGVKLAAITDQPPLVAYQTMIGAVNIQGSTRNANASVNGPPPMMAIAAVTPDFFRASGIALKQGRAFTDADGADTPAVAIVNETFVKQFYPQGFTLGAQINAPSFGGGHGPAATAAIVGVVADIRARGFESAAQPLAYFPLAQQPRARLSAVLQFEGDSAALVRAVTMATHKLDADLALDNPQTLEQQLAKQTAPRRVTLMLTGAFAATAVLLAALGIFGVMSYTVTQRTQEIGVRMALGADANMILRWMLRYGVGAVGIGLVIGLALTAATTRLLTTLFVGVTALDPMVVAAGVGVLAFIGLVACVWPAWLATRVNPVNALRNE